MRATTSRVGDDQVDKAYENLGRVYDYYHDTFGYDSYDGKGRAGGRHRQQLRRRRPRPACPTGATTRVHFAPGAGDALDTAAHEFTHGVTANTRRA